MRLALVVVAAVLFSGSCAATAPASGRPALLLGTTTTTQDTGLLDTLVPDFERRSGYTVKLVVAGSGQILQQAARGDLDVILTHSPTDEEAFVAAGNSADRRLVMHNDFVLIGPAADPAGVVGADIETGLRRIYDRGAPFISRGDRSGTNVKEFALWSAAGLDPRGKPWFVESGVGQLQSMQVAAQKHAYTFTDRGTWLANQSQLADLRIVVEGGRDLLNVYHVIVVDPAKFPKLNATGALAFADYITGTPGQDLIAGFGADRFGRPLFTPDAGKIEDQLQ